MVKRKSGFFLRLCDVGNIEFADSNARKSKKRSLKYIRRHDYNHDKENKAIADSFKNHTYKTSPYTKYKIYEPKERIIYRLPYYPDRIGQHAIMNVVKEYWTKLFIPNTYSCIEERGIHKCLSDVVRDVKKAKKRGLKLYCLKLDIVKFYPSINHEILKTILRRKIKDKDFLLILDEIIDSINHSTDKPGYGIPIGNYLSQFFANLYLTAFDHFCKEQLKCRYYYRYADDIVILDESKDKLRYCNNEINKFLNTNLKLRIKHNYQIFPIDKRGIDFVGYKVYPTHILLRKSIKNRIKRLILKYLDNDIDFDSFKRSMQSYYGWLKYCNAKHFLQTVEEKTSLKLSLFKGIDTKRYKFKGKTVRVIHISEHNKYYVIEFVYKHNGYLIRSKDFRLYNHIINYPINCIL